MSEIGEFYGSLKKHQQEKRADNREKSANLLTAAGIVFTTNNGGAHLIVEGADCYIDFWPGTGRWRTRKGQAGFGVRNLLKELSK